jgi:hypothetical protein
MTAHATGMLIDAVIQLDQPINLPNRSRVTLSIEPLDEPACGSKSVFESFKKLIDEHPIRSGGQHDTRDELHERR